MTITTDLHAAGGISDGGTPSERWKDALFGPRTIAVIGASNDPVKISGRPIEYLKRFGYEGRIIPVNPKRSTVQGLPSYASLDEVEGEIDLAIIVLGAEGAVQALRDCAARGVGAAFLGAAGFHEVGGEGTVRQQELEQIVRGSDMRVIGPNCTGLIGLKNKVMATFSPALDAASVQAQPLREGTVGFVSQSGGVGGFNFTAAQHRGLGISHYVTTGNEVDLTASEMLGLLAERDDVSMMMAYLEALSDGDEFIRSAKIARKNSKPIVALKAGKSAQGAAAVTSHTGALASPGRVFDAVAEQFGIIQVDSMEQLVDTSLLIDSGRRPKGRKMSIVSMSGGLAVLAVDVASTLGLSVEPWDDEWAGRMAAAIPEYGNPRNPIDLTAAIISDTGLLQRSLQVACEHPDTDSILVMLGNTDNGSEHLVESIIASYRDSDVPLAVVWVGGSGKPRELLADAGVPCYSELKRAVTAMASLTDWTLQVEPGGELPTDVDTDAARGIIGAARAAGQGQLDEHESARLLAAYGIKSMPAEVVDTPEQAMEVARRLGGKVVVKVASKQIAHKSDIGGVVVAPEGDEEVRAAAASVLQAGLGAGAADSKILIQAMAEPGLELVLGIQRDPVFGPMVVAGLGGTMVEILDDVKMAKAPIGVQEATGLLKGLRAAAIFDGVRGSHAYDLPAVAQVVSRLSLLAHDFAHEIEEMDVNPLIVGKSGAVAVDGLAVLTESGAGHADS